MKPGICVNCAAPLTALHESVVTIHTADRSNCSGSTYSCPSCGTALHFEIDRSRTADPIGSIDEPT